MKRNGFTLVELLSVIIVLGLIMAVVVPSVIGTIKESKEKAYQTNVEMVKSAAESYINMSFDSYKENFISPGYVNISIPLLVEDGFLKPDIKNPKNGENLMGSVRVTRTSENKYSYEFIEG